MSATQLSNKNDRIWIIKAGSSLLTNHGRGLDVNFIAQWVEQVVQLKSRGIQCILVSSGAVAEGLSRLKISERPHAIHDLQAAAAVGQMGLIQTYETQFQKHQLHTAQILITHDDLSNRQRYLNARSTLKTLLKQNVIPIVNENDTVAIDEIKFGDNDTLAAMVANLMDAERLILLTDQNGMYTDDPRHSKDAELIKTRAAGDSELLTMASKGSSGKFGRGGMLTKVKAAERASLSGCTTIIAGGKETNILLNIEKNLENTGTWLTSDNEPITARKQWLASHMQVKGKLILDDGASDMLTKQGKSLLAIGVTQCEGDFLRGEAVMCTDKSGNPLAIGLTNYSSNDARQILGVSSADIEEILGYVDEPELIHRDNLVIINRQD